MSDFNKSMENCHKLSEYRMRCRGVELLQKKKSKWPISEKRNKVGPGSSYKSGYNYPCKWPFKETQTKSVPTIEMIYTLPPIVLGAKVYWKMSALSPLSGTSLPLNHDCWENCALPKTNLAPKNPIGNHLPDPSGRCQISSREGNHSNQSHFCN